VVRPIYGSLGVKRLTFEALIAVSSQETAVLEVTPPSRVTPLSWRWRQLVLTKPSYSLSRYWLWRFRQQKYEMSNVYSHFEIRRDATLAQKSRAANLDDAYETLFITPYAITHWYVICGNTLYREVSYLGIPLTVWRLTTHIWVVPQH